MSSDTDRIEKKILLRATRNRVWRALTDSGEFGTWFGMRFAEPFAAGKVMRGTMTPTTVDPLVAGHQKEFEGQPFEITIEDIVPERRFSFRWHPAAIERGVDYSHEPTTLIVFELGDADGGILLTVTESGFDRIPLERRAKAFASNERGWGMVIGLVEKYLGSHA